MGGMGISNPVTRAPGEFEMSEQITSTMAALIINQTTKYSTSTQQHLRESRNVLKREKWQRQKDDLQNLKEALTANQQRSLSLTGEEGASTWLTALPIEKMGFTLHKRAFRDAVFLWYCWTPPFLPTNCICGNAFSVKHALSCNRGAFPIHRHNEIRTLRSFSLRCATTFAWNPACKSSTMNTFNYRQQIHITQGWTSVLKASGRGQRGHSLMYGFLALSPQLTSNIS